LSSPARTSVGVGVLALLAFAGMILQVSYPPDPGLKFDLSEPFCVVGGILAGPWAGLLIVLLKNALHLRFVGGDLIGHVCNSWAVGTMTVVAAVLTRRRASLPSASMALGAAVLARAAVMVPVNILAIQHYGMTTGEAARYAVTISLCFNLVQGLATSLLVLVVRRAWQSG
jgi:riboflavin transporter